MPIDKRLLTGLGVTDARARQFLPDLRTALPEHGIDTPLRSAHFLAQVIHESSGMRAVQENLNYSEKALLRVFRKYFTPAKARAYARKPQKIGSRVYANRMGNGDEVSGDGHRYRGRGLIQLTGRNNYRKFSQWVGEDVDAEPDLVAVEYPVHSAVYFWTENGINDLADADDVKRVTKRINGGYNGLAHRVELLDRAKALLGLEARLVALERVTHEVKATKLNLRSRPRVAASTRIGALAEGAPVQKLGDAEVPDWVRIRAVLSGRLVEGFVASGYLRAVRRIARPAVRLAPPIAFEIPEPHLRENRRSITRARDGGRAYPLGEAGRPRRTGRRPQTRARELVEVVRYLDSEKRRHERYWPRGRTTYCNVYAYDYCHLAGAYLPRVWWKETALREILAMRQVPVRYDGTVRELNANALHDWLEDYGPEYGWKRVVTPDVLQAAANNGEVCLVVAKHRDLNRSGHIAAVVPEGDRVQAVRNDAGEVLRPVESQAGSRNHRFVAKSRAWWAGASYQSFGFWRHA